jgi:hypothetical protein
MSFKIMRAYARNNFLALLYVKDGEAIQGSGFGGITSVYFPRLGVLQDDGPSTDNAVFSY